MGEGLGTDREGPRYGREGGLSCLPGPRLSSDVMASEHVARPGHGVARPPAGSAVSHAWRQRRSDLPAGSLSRTGMISRAWRQRRSDLARPNWHDFACLTSVGSRPTSVGSRPVGSRLTLGRISPHAHGVAARAPLAAGRAQGQGQEEKCKSSHRSWCYALRARPLPVPFTRSSGLYLASDLPAGSLFGTGMIS